MRALWARKPFVWHIYPQDDGAHRVKLDAFLDWAQAPKAVRDAHTLWNAASASDASPDILIHGWRDAGLWVQQLADTLGAQRDLVTQLLDTLPANAALPPALRTRRKGDDT